MPESGDSEDDEIVGSVSCSPQSLQRNRNIIDLLGPGAHQQLVNTDALRPTARGGGTGREKCSLVPGPLFLHVGAGWGASA